MGRGSSKAGGGGGGATVDKSREFTETKTKTGMQKILDEADTGSSFNIMLDDGSRLEYKKRNDGQWDVKNIAVDNSLNNERTSPTNVVAARAFRDRADITKANISAKQTKTQAASKTTTKKPQRPRSTQQKKYKA